MQSKTRFLIFTIFSFLVISVFTSCATTKADKEIPLWASYDTIEEIYPNSKYIARIGYSSKKQNAGTLAEGELGTYFSHSVHTVVQGTQTMTESELSDTTVSRKIERIVTVEALENLFDVHKTPVWYDKAKKQYVCCAYINRADAWNLYEQELRNSCSNFRFLYDNAIKEKEPVTKIKLLRQAQIAGQEFREDYSFANMLSESLTQKNYGNDNQNYASISGLIKKEMLSNPVYIEINDDDAGVIESAIRQVFTNLGFTVTNNSSNAFYIVKTQVNYNKTDGTTRVVLNPYISFSLEGKNGSIYSFNTKTEKVVAPNDRAAKKIASQDLAQAIDQNLENDLKRNLGIL